jgi:hypothetical protein
MTEGRRELLLEFEGTMRKYMEDQRRATSRLFSNRIKSHFLRGGDGICRSSTKSVQTKTFKKSKNGGF